MIFFFIYFSDASSKYILSLLDECDYGALVERERKRPTKVPGKNTFPSATFFHHKSHVD